MIVEQIKTKKKQPTQSGWYDTDKGSLYWFNKEKQWSCRDDRISEEYPQLWYNPVSKVKNLALHSVSGSLPVDKDITIFADYITKYFEWYRNDDLYKDKNTGVILPQSVIYEKWKSNER